MPAAPACVFTSFSLIGDSEPSTRQTPGARRRKARVGTFSAPRRTTSASRTSRSGAVDTNTADGRSPMSMVPDNVSLRGSASPGTSSTDRTNAVRAPRGRASLVVTRVEVSGASAGTGSCTGGMPSTSTRHCASGVAIAPATIVAATVIVSPAVAVVGTAISAIAPSVRGALASTRTIEPAGASPSASASSISPSVSSTSGRPSDAARSTAARTREA